MGKYELLRWPLVRIFFKGMDIAVNRGSHVEAAKAFRRAAQAIDEGACIAIFPEGTIPHTAPRMKHFKDGAFKLAIEKQVPIVPITFVNHWKLFGDPQDPLSRGRPGVSRVVVHPSIATTGMGDADLVGLRNRVFETIQAPLIPALGASAS
jgi:1-acyl-sn-glycerol-3-phosphate acyltransferase